MGAFFRIRETGDTLTQPEPKASWGSPGWKPQNLLWNWIRNVAFSLFRGSPLLHSQGTHLGNTEKYWRMSWRQEIDTTMDVLGDNVTRWLEQGLWPQTQRSPSVHAAIVACHWLVTYIMAINLFLTVRETGKFNIKVPAFVRAFLLLLYHPLVEDGRARSSWEALAFVTNLLQRFFSASIHLQGL